MTTLMADTVLISQYNIFELSTNLDAIIVDETNINTESIRSGQLFNRTITMLWDCFMVCGLKRFIVMSFKFISSS